MAAQARGEQGPPRTRAAQERDRHLEQTRGYGFLAGRGPKPLGDRPARRRCATGSTTCPGRSALALRPRRRRGLAGRLRLARRLRRPFRDEAPLALGLGLIVLAAQRLPAHRLRPRRSRPTSPAAGRSAVQRRAADAHPRGAARRCAGGLAEGRAAGWPAGRAGSGSPSAIWPRTAGPSRAFTHWVRDPEAFAAALGHRLWRRRGASVPRDARRWRERRPARGVPRASTTTTAGRALRAARSRASGRPPPSWTWPSSTGC